MTTEKTKVPLTVWLDPDSGVIEATAKWRHVDVSYRMEAIEALAEACVKYIDSNSDETV